jgi:hypothetical protein
MSPTAPGAGGRPHPFAAAAGPGVFLYPHDEMRHDMTTTMIAGVHEKFPPAETATRFPGHEWGRSFVRWSKDVAPIPATATPEQVLALVEAEVRDDLAAGLGCLVSIKFTPSDVMAGRYDAVLKALAQYAVGKKLIIILWHEPEDDWSGKVFAPAFNRARRKMQAVNPGLLVAWAGMGYQWALTNGNTADVAAWRTIEADLYLLDVYSGNTFAPDLILPEHPGFVRWHREIIAPFPGRLWGIGERGFAAGPKRAASWEREFVWLTTDPVGRTCSAYLPWGTGGTEQSSAWPFADDPATLRVVRAGIAAITAPPAPEVQPAPAGYSNTYTVGLLLHEATGAAVFESHVAEWNGFVERVRVAAGAAQAAAAVVTAPSSPS